MEQMHVFCHQSCHIVGLRSRAMRGASIYVLFVVGFVVAALTSVQTSAQQTRPVSTLETSQTLRAVLDGYCISCHNQRLRTAGLAFDSFDVTKPHANPDVWERVIAKLRAGSMPPPGPP